MTALTISMAILTAGRPTAGPESDHARPRATKNTTAITIDDEIHRRSLSRWSTSRRKYRTSQRRLIAHLYIFYTRGRGYATLLRRHAMVR